MRIGIVSDTHNNLKSVKRIVEIFNDARVERVIHTGDITQPKTLDAFSDLTMPLYGIFGNNDLELVSLNESISKWGYHFVHPPMTDTWFDKRLIVVHDPRDLEEHDLDQFDLALHGHTHRYRLEKKNATTIFNPGECAGHMVGYNAVGVLDLNSMAIELIKF